MRSFESQGYINEHHAINYLSSAQWRHVSLTTPTTRPQLLSMALTAAAPPPVPFVGDFTAGQAYLRLNLQPFGNCQSWQRYQRDFPHVLGRPRTSMLRFVTSSLSHNIVAQYSNMRDLFGSFALLVFLVGLALAEPPTAVRRPQSKRAITGTRVFFRCIGRGQPPPFVSWYDGRSRLVKSAGRYHLRQRNRTLMIERVNDGDAGTYQCVLTDPTNPLNRRSYMAVLEVVKRRRPIIVSKPSDLTAREGDDVRLYCAATGVPRPKIRWLMHEATALASTLIHKSNRKYILRPNTLIIKNITRRDGEKVYFCRAENEEAHAQVSITIRVKVKSMGTMDTYRHGTMHMMYTSSTARPRIFGPFNNNNNNKGGTDENEQRNNDLLLDQTRHRRLPFRVGEASIRRAIEKARTEVNLAIDKTLRRLRRRGQQRSPSDILTLFRLPSDAAVELSRAGEVYEAALQEVTIIMRQRAAHFNLSIADFPNWGLEPDELAVLGQLSGEQLINIKNAHWNWTCVKWMQK